jgi:hypothetical protein
MPEGAVAGAESFAAAPPQAIALVTNKTRRLFAESIIDPRFCRFISGNNSAVIGDAVPSLTRCRASVEVSHKFIEKWSCGAPIVLSSGAGAASETTKEGRAVRPSR